MEKSDLEILDAHIKEDPHLASLYKDHISFEKRLAKLDNKLFLTPEEELERKELQKKKLKGKDLIESILEQYRGNSGGN